MSEYINKSEKLASAIYLVTSFFSDLEPLKWKLRTLASELVSLGVSLNDGKLKDREVIISEVRNLILRVGKYFSVARNVGLVSTDNNNLMQEELKKYTGTLDRPASFSDFLRTEPTKLKIEEAGETLMISDKIEQKPPEKPLRVFGAVSVKKNSRQSIIIGVLKRKKEIMIKDVSSLISGCSEKTIQRELSNMVHTGVLKKTGEKRWSRYSLARP